MIREKFAVLIVGDNAENGQYCFWHDVVLMREALLQNGFAYDHIFVLYADGKDYDNWFRPNPCYRPDPPITDAPADEDGVKDVFTNLASWMTDDDLLFIWTFDHGTRKKGHSVLNLYRPFPLEWILGKSYMYDTDFAELVNKIPHAYRVICMQHATAVDSEELILRATRLRS